MKEAMNQYAQKLADARSRRVVFLSHCILNENVRYPGGAFTGGMISSIIHDLDSLGYGIVQMPCPEQQAWGGVNKPLIWLSFGIRGSFLYSLRFLLLPLFRFYTRRRYRHIARQVSRQIRDYRRSGFTVAGIVGIDGSPSCGVKAALDLKRCFALYSSLSPDTLDRDEMNERMYGECRRDGRGIFMEELERALRKLDISISFSAHDLMKEAGIEKRR